MTLVLKIMGAKTLVSLMIGSIAGYISYIAYQNTGAASAVVVFFTSSWLLHRFSSFERIWNTLGYFLNPVMTLILVGLAGFSYYAVVGEMFLSAAISAIGLSFLGAAFGMMVFKYWTIGD